MWARRTIRTGVSRLFAASTAARNEQSPVAASTHVVPALSARSESSVVSTVNVVDAALAKLGADRC